VERSRAVYAVGSDTYTVHSAGKPSKTWMTREDRRLKENTQTQRSSGLLGPVRIVAAETASAKF
jgi:hypothetical protein